MALQVVSESRAVRLKVLGVPNWRKPARHVRLYHIISIHSNSNQLGQVQLNLSRPTSKETQLGSCQRLCLPSSPATHAPSHHPRGTSRKQNPDSPPCKNTQTGHPPSGISPAGIHTFSCKQSSSHCLSSAFPPNPGCGHSFAPPVNTPGLARVP